MPHIHEKIDFTIEVFVVHGDRVLMRLHDKYDIWLGVGGHVELDEDPNQAALREVKEEVGLDIVLHGATKPEYAKESIELIPPVFLNRHRINKNHEHVTMIYFGTLASDTQKIVSTDGRETRWLTQDELDSLKPPLSPAVKYYAEEALKRLGNLN